jgi:hypothetical protein
LLRRRRESDANENCCHPNAARLAAARSNDSEGAFVDRRAAQAGASLIVFPEAYVPGYPTWIWRLRLGKIGRGSGTVNPPQMTLSTSGAPFLFQPDNRPAIGQYRPHVIADEWNAL